MTGKKLSQFDHKAFSVVQKCPKAKKLPNVFKLFRTTDRNVSAKKKTSPGLLWVVELLQLPRRTRFVWTC